MGFATITAKGQVTIPKEVRDKLHLVRGERVDFRVDSKAGLAILVPLNRQVEDVCGMLKGYARRAALSVEEMDNAIGSRASGKKR